MEGGELMFWGRMPGVMRGRALAGVTLSANAGLYLNILNLLAQKKAAFLLSNRQAN